MGSFKNVIIILQTIVIAILIYVIAMDCKPIKVIFPTPEIDFPVLPPDQPDDEPEPDRGRRIFPFF